ncbi:MAG: helix-turn-helix transcriptional regulator [Ignavibacteriales bacterium]|nr:helix-turn-helix transcriptional regulator [Ignavibacteriales bacterium]
MNTRREITVLDTDPSARQQMISGALRRFTNVLDSRLGFFPSEVQIMLRYIHEHLFEETLTVESVKEACQLKNNNVTTKFLQTVGVGTREYIVSQRLKAAASILHTTEVSIYQIAFAVGFTEETFSKLFKKKYGCTPLNYRRERSKRNGQEK